MCVSFHMAKEAITIVSVMNAHARAKLAYVVVRRYARLTLVHQTREDRVRWTLQIQLGGLGEWPIVEYVLVITYINQRLRSSVS